MTYLSDSDRKLIADSLKELGIDPYKVPEHTSTPRQECVNQATEGDAVSNESNGMFIYNPLTGKPSRVEEGSSIAPQDLAQDNPLPWATAEVSVPTKLYGAWMASVRDRLPKGVRWGDDINATISVSGLDNVKVKWRARTQAGIDYLNCLGNTLANAALPSPAPELPAAPERPKQIEGVIDAEIVE